MAYGRAADSSGKNAGFAEKEEESLGSSLYELAAKNDVQRLTSKLSSLRLSQQGDHEIAVFVNQKDKLHGRTLLHTAAINNTVQSHFELAEILLNNGADPNAKDKNGRTPLWYLILHSCNVEIMKLLYKFKADFINFSKNEISLFFNPIINPDLEKLKFIVQDVGLDVNCLDKFRGMTPLHEAAYCNRNESHHDVLKFLLDNGADVNARDNNGLTPLWYLIKYSGNWRVIDLFLNHNADLHTVTNSAKNIIFAFDSDDCDLQVLDKFIKDFELNVNHTDFDKQTPLHCIIDKSIDSYQINTKIIKFLLKNGANINAPGKNGLTPTIEAVCMFEEFYEEEIFFNFDFFSFIINQTDFNVVHNNKHIFYNYDDDDDEALPYPKNLWEWILKHLAKLEFLNIPIHPTTQKFIKNHISYKDYFKKCTVELKMMSSTKPKNSWINFINLLVDSRRKLKNYAGNEDLIRDFENNEWLKMFPIYGALLKKNVEKGIKRRELFDKSSISLSYCLPIFNCNHLIIKDILDCILSKKVLSKFCK